MVTTVGAEEDLEATRMVVLMVMDQVEGDGAPIHLMVLVVVCVIKEKQKDSHKLPVSST